MITGTTLSSISGVTDYSDSTASTDTSNSTIDTNTFTTLLLAQLKYQDPLNPMDSSQFSSQLAQFSSLEQLTNINSNLEAMKESQNTNTKYKALDMIGKQIEADGNDIVLEGGESASGRFTLDSAAASCSAVIYDSNGTTVKTIDLGALSAGEHTFTWDGTNLKGTALGEGIYNYNIVAKDKLGNSIDTETKIMGIVNKIDLSEDDPLLYVGSLSIPLSEISSITLAAD
jgi:flagellar basal-body rod modification protein FlgD